MTRLGIGRKGDVVSSHAPEDWMEIDPRPAATESRRSAFARRTPAPRQVTVLVAILVAIAVSAFVLVLAFGRGDDRAASTSTPPTVAPATADTTPSTPVAALVVKLPQQGKLGMGASGASVTQFQRALVAVGLDPGPRDGAFGSRTQAAVIAFQKRHDLVADGVVGAKTVSALNAAIVDSTR